MASIETFEVDCSRLTALLLLDLYDLFCLYAGVPIQTFQIEVFKVHCTYINLIGIIFQSPTSSWIHGINRMLQSILLTRLQ